MSLPENFNSSNLNPLSSNPLDFNANIDPLGLPSGLNNTKQILVIAPDIDDYQSLIDGINPQIVEVVKLNLATDGILQISDVLKRYQGQGIDAVHIATHGGAGNLKLGSVDLNTQTLRNYQSDLESWGNALTNDADILFYGCNLAACMSSYNSLKCRKFFFPVSQPLSCFLLQVCCFNPRWPTATVSTS